MNLPHTEQTPYTEILDPYPVDDETIIMIMMLMFKVFQTRGSLLPTSKSHFCQVSRKPKLISVHMQLCYEASPHQLVFLFASSVSSH